MSACKTIIITTSPQAVSLTNFFIEIGKQFHRNGYTVIMLFDKQKVRDQKVEGLIYKTWPSYRPTRLKDFFFLRKLIKQYKPEIMISSFGAVNISLIGGWFFGVPKRIAWNHTRFQAIIKDSKNKLLTKLLTYRKQLVLRYFATELHTNSESTAEDVVTFLKYPRNKIKIIKFLLDSQFAKGGCNKKEKISFVGRFSPSKGQDILIKAIPRILVEFPTYQFVFIGDGPMKNDCQKLAKDLGVITNCVFTGNLSQEEVYKQLVDSKLHVSASIDEAFGLVNLEAIAHNTPILAHNVGGISEVLKDSINGYFFAQNDDVDLALKIIQILKDKQLYHNLQEGCEKVYTNDFELSEKNLQKKVALIIS